MNIIANVWLDQAKYLQITWKSIWVNATPIVNSGIANINLFFNPSCFILKASAIVSLALLKAVSPEVIGQATTPRTARTAPAGPNNAFDIILTISAGWPADCIDKLSPKML